MKFQSRNSFVIIFLVLSVRNYDIKKLCKSITDFDKINGSKIEVGSLLNLRGSLLNPEQNHSKFDRQDENGSAYIINYNGIQSVVKLERTPLEETELLAPVLPTRKWSTKHPNLLRLRLLYIQR